LHSLFFCNADAYLSFLEQKIIGGPPAVPQQTPCWRPLM